MSAIAILWVGLGLVSVLLIWCMPNRQGQNCVCALTAIALIIVSPLAATALLTISFSLPFIMQWAETRQAKNGVMVALGFILAGVFISSRYLENYVWVGVAYFALRLFHVLIEWWSGRIAIPSVSSHLRYQLFLPVIVAGPINRIEHFQRECDRRSWSERNFWSGAERALIGLFFVVVLSNWALGRIELALERQMMLLPQFLFDWLLSAVDWIQLYFGFAGYTSIALGISLMMGLRLEENFNKPFLATNLIDFWSRWHMTLTNWCRDYVFQPLAALTRSPFLAIICAMLVLGLWHEFSAYYVFWAMWQAMGIVGTHIILKFSSFRVPSTVAAFFGPILVLSWLSLSRPAINLLLEIS